MKKGKKKNINIAPKIHSKLGDYLFETHHNISSN